MEILGDDEAGLPTPPRRGLFGRDDGRPDAPVEALTLDDPAHLNGSAPAAPGDGHGGGGPDDADAPAPGRSALLLDTLFGAEALGLAALLTTVAGVLTTSISPFVVMLRTEALTGLSDPSQSVRSVYSPVVVGFALVGLALGVAAVLRVRRTSPAWVRGVAGAAVLLAVLVLLTTGWAIWNAETGTPADALAGR